jgi:hypothetical protein
LPDQVARTESALDPRKRKIDFVALGSRLFRRSFHRPLAFCDNGFNVRLELVQLLTDGGLQFRRRSLQPVIRDLREDSRFAAGPSEDESLQTFPV